MRMKERVTMLFGLRTFITSEAIRGPLLPLRGAKRADLVAAAN